MNPLFTTKEEIIDWFDSKNVDRMAYTIDDELNVSTGGSMHLSNQNISYLPFKFKHIDGDFVISDNQLTSLFGMPEIVEGEFFCDNNLITTLDFVPNFAYTLDFSGNPLVLNALPQIEFYTFMHACEKESEKLAIFKHSYEFNSRTNQFELNVEMDELEKVLSFNEKMSLENTITTNELFQSKIKL
jgi:hypothetical protein